MVREIIQIGDSRLNEVSEIINENSISSGKIQSLAEDLVTTCRFHVQSAAGLSAVQVGEMVRMFAVRRLDLDKEDEPFELNAKWEVLINPEIVIEDESLNLEWEGCMSINSGNRRLFGPVRRPKRVKVKYITLDGKAKSLSVSGFFSHLMQHELDHLNGILFLSYIANPKNIWKENEFSTYLKTNNEYPPIV